MCARARLDCDDVGARRWRGTHERKDQAAAPSHPITRQPHRPVMQYSQERGARDSLKE